MSYNTFGHVFRVTTWGESHGPALGATVDGCPPGVPLHEGQIQVWLDRRRPGQNRYMTQRQEPDQVRILSGVFEGVTTGTPIQLMIENTDQRSKDYSEIAEKFRPGHADVAYWQKYGTRSTAAVSTGTWSKATRFGCPTRRRPRNGPSCWTRSARPGRPWAR